MEESLYSRPKKNMKSSARILEKGLPQSLRRIGLQELKASNILWPDLYNARVAELVYALDLDSRNFAGSTPVMGTNLIRIKYAIY